MEKKLHSAHSLCTVGLSLSNNIHFTQKSWNYRHDSDTCEHDVDGVLYIFVSTLSCFCNDAKVKSCHTGTMLASFPGSRVAHAREPGNEASTMLTCCPYSVQEFGEVKLIKQRVKDLTQPRSQASPVFLFFGLCSV